MNRPVRDEEYMAQFAEIVRQVQIYNAKQPGRSVQALHVYNDGLFFNDDEIRPEARIALYEHAKALDVEKLAVETIPRISFWRNYRRTIRTIGNRRF